MSAPSHPPDPATTPASVLTGSLGSGKTTLLNALLSHPQMAETAVLINEFGEIGIDHLLVETLDDDVVLLNAGCLCCTIRNDLVESLVSLFERRQAGEIPWFRRVMVETTGLADPAPILHTLLGHQALEDRYCVDGIVTTVDAVNAHRQLDSQPESIKQIAVADRIVVTKTDLCEPGAVEALHARLGAINPGATRLEAVNGALEPRHVLDVGLFDPSTKIPDVERWLNEAAYARIPTTTATTSTATTTGFMHSPSSRPSRWSCAGSSPGSSSCWRCTATSCCA